MADLRLISIEEPQAWDAALERCGAADTYHLAGYHRLAQENGEGDPLLAYFEDRGRAAALPMMIRPVAEIEGLEGVQYRDAGSVYGYPGVVTSIRRHDFGAEQYHRRFQAALREALNSLGIVSFFTRQNPLLDTAWMLWPMVTVTRLGPTVVLDLGEAEEQQWSHLRENHRRDIRHARRSGLTVVDDGQLAAIDQFEKIYHETMDRAGAAEFYYFGPSYFARLKRHLGEHVRLFYCHRDGQMICGALVLATGNILQYHLGATATAGAGYRGAMKLIFDEVRQWGAQRGYRWLHLGGGLGATRDSLFHFKAGFSNRLCQFETANMVLRDDIYGELVGRRRQWQQGHGETNARDWCFPAYRHAGGPRPPLLRPSGPQPHRRAA